MRNTLIGYLLFLFLFGRSTAQYIDYIPIYINPTFPGMRHIDISWSEIRNYGIGNYGFDSNINFYNQKYFANGSSFSINVASSINYTGREQGAKNRFVNVASTNGYDLIPDLYIGYKLKNIKLNLFYKSDSYSNEKTELLTMVFFQYEGQDHICYIYDPEYEFGNEVIKFSGSIRTNNNSSVTFGILTNNYHHQIRGKGGTEVSFRQSNFSNFQVYSSLNYLSENTNAYLMAKSQSVFNKLKMKIKCSDSFKTSFRDGRVSFPGLVAYGIQVKTKDYLKLSIEMAHEFIEYEKKELPDKYVNKSLFNTEIILGSNIILSNCIQLGFLGSYYLKYTNNSTDNGSYDTQYMDLKLYKDRTSWITAKNRPVMMQASVNFSSLIYHIDLWYQYSFSYSEYSMKHSVPSYPEYDPGYSENPDFIIKTSNHLFTLSMGIEL